MTITSSPAAILDRDGVINFERGYVHLIEDFEFISGALEACRRFHEAGYRLVVVTNQAGIARGYYDESAFHRLTAWMKECFIQAGAPLSGVYFCPHHPEAETKRYRTKCACRKPAPGMILQAAAELNLNLAASFLVGDKVSDIEAAEAAGVPRRFLVRTGHGFQDGGSRLAEATCESLHDVADTLGLGGFNSHISIVAGNSP